ncbi:MAG: MEDS domain-containing protein [Nitrososphaerales archaeon]
MSGATSEMSEGLRNPGGVKQGSHIAYIFDLSSEKQSTLFQFCERAVSTHNSYLLYLSGKQGVKGIRLSLKDVGFDVAFYERAKQFKIVDAEEWYLDSVRQKDFKSNEELVSQISSIATEAVSCGYPYATIISETDSLVRKGFYSKYLEFDEYLGRSMIGVKAALVCAFDQRELEAAGAKGARDRISKVHSALL